MAILEQSKHHPKQRNGCELVKSHILTKFKAGEKLPTEDELSKMVGTTRYAASRALTELSAERLVQRRPGFGTVLSGSTITLEPGKVVTKIAFMADEFESFMNVEIMRGIDARCREKNLSIVLINNDFNCKAEEKNLRDLVPSGYYGAILRTGEHKENLNLLEKVVPANYPMVLVDRRGENTKFPCIEINHEKAAYESVKYLTRLGHRRIGYITYDIRDNGGWSELQAREAGYRKALAEEGIAVSDNYIQGGKAFGPNEKPTDFYFDSVGYEPMNRLLMQKERPTAVFLMNCCFAAGAFRAIRDHGLKVPDDISLISIDDGPEARFAAVPLTVMAQPLREMGAKAVDKLIERLEGKVDDGECILMDCTLIVRESAASPR